MKVLVVSNLFPPDVLGGYELGCRQVVDGLKAAGHTVTVATSAPRKPAPPEPGVLRRLRLTEVYDPYLFFQTPQAVLTAQALEGYGFNAHNVHVLAEMIEETKPDVVYLWNLVGLGGLSLIAAVQQMGMPWVMHIMDKVPLSLCGLGPMLPANEAIGRAFTTACRGRFLCCSETVLSEIETGGVPIRPFSHVVPNWVVTDGMPGRTEYCPDGHLRIVSAGSLHANKGTDIVIAAAGKLRDRGHTNFTLDIYGFGDEGPFRTQILELGLSNHVRILGRRTQDELNALYPHYDLFAFPTWAREPFGFAPLEAAAFGCVPIVSRACGFAEWFQDGIHCIKADRTVEDFADAFEAAASGKLDLAAYGQAVSRLVLSDFHLRAVLPMIEGELDDAARKKPAVAARSAVDAYRTAVLAEKVFQVLIHNPPSAKEPTPPPMPTVLESLPSDYNFFDYAPPGGSTGRVLTPLRRAARKLMLPMFQRLRDLLAVLGGTSRNHEQRLLDLEVGLARQLRHTQALIAEQVATQRLVARLEVEKHDKARLSAGARERAA